MFKKVHKLGKCTLSLLVACTMMAQSPFTAVKATGTDGDIQVKQFNDSLTIGNEFINREFSTVNQQLSTESITNKRTGEGDTVFTPASGSEEFIIKFTKEASDPVDIPALDRTGWSAKASSWNNDSGASDGPASNLLDGDLNSIWHTNYNKDEATHGPKNYPYNVIFNLNGEQTFQCFSYTPRQQGEQINGNIKGYELYTANSDNELAADSNEWELAAKGNFTYDGVNPIYVNLDEPVTANQVKLVAVSANNGLQFAGGAEFNLHADKAPVSVDDGRTLSASDLTLQKDGVTVEDTSAVINKVDKTGKKVTFAFEPYTFKDVTYTIKENIVMYEGDHFMRKYLEISVPNDQKTDAVIDYIDLESLVTNEDDATWTIPTGAGGVVSLDEYKANLGQPIYIQGMFFGCEFPVTDTEIVDQTGFMRYYSGKSFEQLGLDHQLTADTNQATYVTWQTVAGAARSTEYDVIQTDFFEYINSISTPSEFRIQYNSWFDNMMLIDDENILNSFIEMDKELNRAEVRPLDSYVVDDGWNNYNDTSIVDANRSGTTLNQSGFWEFNSKFPDGLKPSSDLVHNFGSNFGVWVGPRGGYNFFGSLANILTKSGKGSKAGGAVDVADRTYVENFKDMAISWQQEYGVNYWKWDGYADNSQYNTFPAADGVPSRANNHMTGGYKNMYHVTDLWEAWIDLFEAVRESEVEDDVTNLWISLTCYVNPSPWFLQWANSVWLQCTADRAESGPLGNKMDNMLTYREAVYYDFIKNHQFQFPLANIYNHDPVYGTEGTGINAKSMTDEQFSNYLYMMSTRGTGFWELYFSDSIMTKGKYEVTGEFLEWAEDNFHILRNAKMIGGNPAEGVKLGGNNANGTYQTYGFSAWDGEDGIISMRNPDNKTQTITFTLDRNIGLTESVQGKVLNRTTIHSYAMPDGSDDAYRSLHYGDTVTITLQPGETRIWSLSTTADETVPEYSRISTDGSKTIHVKFNEKVSGELFSVKDATISKITKSEDEVSYDITLTTAPKDGAVLEVTALDIKDLAGNSVENATITTTYHHDNLVGSVAEETVTTEKIVLDKAHSFYGNGSFTAAVKVTSESSNTVLATQKDGYTIGIDAEGKATFTLNGATATSASAINDGEAHSIVGVKENNGMMKLYIDGELDSSAYLAENQFYIIKQNDITLGSANFSGTLGLQVLDRGYGYDEIADLVNPDPERRPLPTADMSVSVNGGTSEGNMDSVFDNDPTTFWTSVAASDGIAKGDPAMIIDLGGTYMVDRFDYTKRFYNGPQNIWKCTGNLRDYILEVSEDGENWKTVSEGATFEDEKYTTKGDGGTTQITFEPVKAAYVRISGTSSYHWQAENINKFMTVGDVNIFGEEIEATNLALNKQVTGAWTATGDPVKVDPNKPLGNMVDGNKAISSYADFGDDNRAESSYVQVDLEKVSDIEELHLTRYFQDSRTYKGTVIALSETADFTNPVIVYNSDAENVHGFGAGTESLYAETADGKQIVLNEHVKARYVRIYMHGHGTNKNTNHIVELEVMGTQDTTGPDVIDSSVLIERLAELSKVKTDHTTEDSKAAFDAVLKEAYALLSTAETQEEITEMLERLDRIEETLVDVTELEAAIAEAEEIYHTMTISSAAELKNAIDIANALMKNGTDDTIRAAIADLKEKQEDPALEERGTTEELSALIEKLEGEQLNPSDYTPASWLRYQTALTAANEAIADHSDLTQNEINALKAELEAARKELTSTDEPIDKSALEALIAQGKKDLEGNYTDASKNELTAAIRQAEDALADEATVTEVSEAYERLANAIANKKFAANKDALETQIEIAEKVVADINSYVPSTVSELKELLKKAQDVKDNKEATQTEVDEITAALTKANMKARTKADKTALNAMIENVNVLDLSVYTPASAEALNIAMENAKTVLADENATQDAVNNALTLVEQAIGNLVKAPDAAPGEGNTADNGETGSGAAAENGSNTGDASNAGALIVLLAISGCAAMAFTRKKEEE